jgi:hypothetical protein
MSIPADWLPPAKMHRVIAHWTAGKHTADSLARAHYHIVVEGDGKLVRGTYSINANAVPMNRGYAAHTRNCNSGSIGISMCSMLDAKEIPFDAGPYPFTKVQWAAMVQAIAELCQRYKIPVTRETVLSHAEVERTLNIKQRQKWDIARIPYDLETRGARTIGDIMRAEVIMRMNLLDGVDNPEIAPVVPRYDADRPLWAYNLFRNMGWSRVAAIALVANAQQESYHDLLFIDPKGKPVVGDKHLPGGSIGLFQWNNGSRGQFNRRSQFEKFAKSLGTTTTDFETNIRFADFELKTTEKTAGNALKAAQTIYAANRAAIGFLRPQHWSALNPQKGHGWKNRLNNALALDKRIP